MKNFVLGESIQARAVVQPRDAASPCAPDDALRLVAQARLLRKGAVPPQFELAIENPSDREIDICLLRFSVIGGPLLLVELHDAHGADLLPPSPEIYPAPGDRVSFERFTLSAKSRVALRQPIPSAPKAMPAGATVKWSLWLNGQSRSGKIDLLP